MWLARSSERRREIRVSHPDRRCLRRSQRIENRKGGFEARPRIAGRSNRRTSRDLDVSASGEVPGGSRSSRTTDRARTAMAGSTGRTARSRRSEPAGRAPSRAAGPGRPSGSGRASDVRPTQPGSARCRGGLRGCGVPRRRRGRAVAAVAHRGAGDGSRIARGGGRGDRSSANRRDALCKSPGPRRSRSGSGPNRSRSGSVTSIAWSRIFDGGGCCWSGPRSRALGPGVQRFEQSIGRRIEQLPVRRVDDAMTLVIDGVSEAVQSFDPTRRTQGHSLDRSVGLTVSRRVARSSAWAEIKGARRRSMPESPGEISMLRCVPAPVRSLLAPVRWWRMLDGSGSGGDGGITRFRDVSRFGSDCRRPGRPRSSARDGARDRSPFDPLVGRGSTPRP